MVEVAQRFKTMKRSMVEKYLVVGVTVLLCLANYNGAINVFVSLFYIFIGLVCTYRVARSWKLLIIYGWILYSNYSIGMAFFIDPINSFFTTYANTVIGAYGNNIILFFSICLYLIVPDSFERKKLNNSIINKNNARNDAFCVCLLLAVVIIFFVGIAEPSQVNGRSDGSPVYEYSIILFILAFYYAGKSRIWEILFSGIIVLYAIQGFVFGGRIAGIQQIVCLFLCVFCEKVTFKKTIPFLIIMYLIMTLIGQFRVALSISIDLLKSAFLNIFDGKFVFDTAYSACHTSMTFLDVAQSVPWATRIDLFWQWMKSIVFGSSVSDSVLPVYTRQFIPHYFGGILPFYFYFYLGILGIVLITIYLRYLIKMISSVSVCSSGYSRCLSIYLSSSVFRWYLYSPSNLFRGILFMSLAYAGLWLVNGVMQPKPTFVEER